MGLLLNYLLGSFLFQQIFGTVAVVLVSAWLLKCVWMRTVKLKGPLTVLVTGCDAGIGWQAAKRLDKLGLHVFAGCRNPLGVGAMRLKDNTSANLHLVALDVTSEQQVARAASFVRDNLPDGVKGLHCVVNLCVEFLMGDLEWTTDEQCLNQLNTVVVGTARVARHFLPLLRKARGRLVNTTPVPGRFGLSQLSLPCATSFAIEGLSRSLRQELRSSGIKVSVVELGHLPPAQAQMLKPSADKMWESMTTEAQDLVGPYFDKWSMSLEAASRRLTCRTNLKVTLKDLTDAVLSSSPLHRYVSGSATLRLAVFLLGVLPEDVADACADWLLDLSTKRPSRHVT